jgi:CDP-paratose 2-epimerase
MKYLITGGCGFLGSNISVELLKRGEEIVVFDDLSRLGAQLNLDWLKQNGDFNYVSGDIRDQSTVEKTIASEKPDAIFHLAGQVAMTTSIANPRFDFEVNALGSFNVLDSVRKYSPDSLIVYSSTNKVYGDLEWTAYDETDTRYIARDFPNGFPETVPLEFHSPYGCSKGAADQYMLDFHRIFGIRTIVFRHSSMYGGRQFSTYDQGWVGWFCQKALEVKNNLAKEPFTISGTGKQVRDLLHASDMVELYLQVANDIEKVKGQVFNIGGGIQNSLSLLELFDILEKELGINMEYIKLPPRESDQRLFVADIKKITNAIGWKPKVDKYSGIKQMLGWVSQSV